MFETRVVFGNMYVFERYVVNANNLFVHELCAQTRYCLRLACLQS